MGISITNKNSSGFFSDLKVGDPVPGKAAPDRCAQCAETMGRREADGRGAMSTSGRSELGCLQDAAFSSHHGGEQSPKMDTRRACNAEKRQKNTGAEEVGQASAAAAAPMEVKKHQHKHNLKHRYEVMETLGKGTYGKVKKAVERASLKTVSHGHHNSPYHTV